MAVDFGSSSSFMNGGVATPILTFNTAGISKPYSEVVYLYGGSAGNNPNAGIGNFAFPQNLLDNQGLIAAFSGPPVTYYATFYVPANGTYYCYFQSLATNATTGEYRFAFYKNGAAYSGGIYIHQAYSANYSSVFCSSHINAAAGDNIQLVYVSGPTTTTNLFSGDNNYGQLSIYYIG